MIDWVHAELHHTLATSTPSLPQTLTPTVRNLDFLCLLLISLGKKLQNAYGVVQELMAFVWARSKVIYTSAVLWKFS